MQRAELEAGRGHAPRATGSNPLEGRGPRRLRLAGRLGIGLGLALALSGPARALSRPAPQATLLERLNSAVARGPDALHEILAELDGSTSDGASARRARTLTWLALAGASTGEERDTGLSEARSLLADQPPDPALVQASCKLASALLNAGKLEGTELVASFALGSFARFEPVGALLLWRIRVEAARQLGNWEHALQLVEDWEGALDATLAELGRARPASEGREDLTATEHWYRALIGLAQAQILLELGLLDRARERATAAETEALAAGDPQALQAVWLLRCDLDLLRQDFAGVVSLTTRLSKEPRFAGLSPYLLPYRAVALLELVRQDLDAGRDPEKNESAARALLTQPSGEPQDAAGRLKMRLAACELELMIGDADAARAELGRARELLAKGPVSGVELRERLLLPTYRWEIARRFEGTPEERSAARAEVGRAFDELLAQWADTPERRGGIGFLHLSWRTQIVSAALEAELDAGGDDAARRALRVLLRTQALGTRARREGGAVPELARIQTELLAPGRGAVVLFPAHFRTHLFTLDEKSVCHFDIPASRDVLRVLAPEVTGALLDPRGPAGTRAASALSEAVLPAEALAQLTAWREVYALGFDLLGDLPFGALVDRAQKPLGARLACATLPSFAYGLQLATRKRGPATTRDLALIVAQSPGLAGLAPFNFGAAERQRLTRAFKSSEVLEGESATSAAVRSRCWSDASVLLFLTHGTRLPKREFTSALVLSAPAGGGECVLDAEDVAALEVGPLVVLAACGTGRGPPRIGDDQLVSLGGAFLDAGARCVVLARFPVEYEATLALMERFTDALAKGRSPAQAWSEARATAADELDSFHGGAFEILGLGHEPVFSGLEGVRR